jgi:hypothetical protein
MLLVVIACLLLWRIIETWRRPLEAYVSPGPQHREEDNLLPSVHAFSPHIGKRYAESIADKDLFSPDRRRAVKDPPPVATVPPPSHLKLVGVMLASGKAEAFFSDATQGGKVVRIRTGEAVGSYKLVKVTPLQATLTMGPDGDEVTLPLLVLDSQTAGQASRVLSAVMPTTPDRVVQQQEDQSTQSRSGRVRATAAAETTPTDEPRAIRQNIQQLQQRLRQMRKQAASENSNGEEGDTSDDEEG